MCKHIKALLFFLWSIFWTCNDLWAEDLAFSSGLVQQTVETLQLHDLDTLPDGLSLITYQDRYPLRVETRQGRITHIGRQLFADAFYTETRPPILDYLEFAWLNKTFNVTDNPFTFQDLRITEGDWKLFDEVTVDTPCTIQSEEGVYYEVSWQLTDAKRLTIHVPVHYDRIQLMTRRELEEQLLFEWGMMTSGQPTSMPLDTSRLAPTEIEGISQLIGETYIHPEINGDTFYRQDDSGRFMLVCDERLPEETLSNLVNATDSTMPPCPVMLEARRYDYRIDTLCIMLSDLTHYCRKQGCKVYWGIESMEGSAFSGSIFVYNNGLCYNHVIHLTGDIHDVIDHQGSCRATIAMFVPTNNIENMFLITEPHPKRTDRKIKINSSSPVN